MKFDDILFLMKNISDEMPLHSENTASVPHKYGNLPKDIMKESHKKDNKFLNNHLDEIEEAIDKNFIDKNSFIKQVWSSELFFAANFANFCGWDIR